MAKRLVALFLMIIMTVAPVAVVSAVELNTAEIGSSGAFIPRLTAPSKSNKYYYSDINILYSVGYGMPNCTAYAWGRAYEILGHKPDLSVNDADCWWDYNKENKAYPSGQTPKLGAVACWNYTYGGGHVAVVEKIENGEITFSNSSYGGKNFYLTYADVDDYNGGIYDSTWDFQGYIYITDGQTKEEYYQSLGGDVYTIDSDDGVNMRKGAGTSFSTITAIPDGTQIVVKETKNADGYTWGKTSYDGYTGWCVLDFAKLVYKQPKPTTPSVTVPPTTAPVTTVPATTVTEPSEPAESLPSTFDEATLDEVFTEPVETTAQVDTTLATTGADGAEPTISTEPSTGEGQATFVGDANGDGKISIADATLIQKYLAKIGELSDNSKKAADLNSDGRITVADATIIQKKLAGIL